MGGPEEAKDGLFVCVAQGVVNASCGRVSHVDASTSVLHPSMASHAPAFHPRQLPPLRHRHGPAMAKVALKAGQLPGSPFGLAPTPTAIRADVAISSERPATRSKKGATDISDEQAVVGSTASYFRRRSCEKHKTPTPAHTGRGGRLMWSRPRRRAAPLSRSSGRRDG